MQLENRESVLQEYVSKMKIVSSFEESDVWVDILEPMIKDRIALHVGGYDENGAYKSKTAKKTPEVCLEIVSELGALINFVKSAQDEVTVGEVEIKKVRDARGA